MAEPSTAPKKKKTRSPSYPGIDLETALQRVRELHDKEKRHFVAAKVVMGHWRYAEKSGPGQVTLAAVKKFGLIDDKGTGAAREVRVSELAFRIIRDLREDSPDRESAIQEAALKPTIHAELWEKYEGELPTDQNLKYYLEFEKSFSESAVDDFIAQLRRTIAFANLTKQRIESNDEEDKVDPDAQDTKSDGGLPKVKTDNSTEILDLPIPLIGGGRAVLRTPIPLSTENFELLTTLLGSTLTGMRKAIVREDSERDPSE